MVFVVTLERKLGLSFHGPAGRGRRGRLGNLNTRFRSTRAHTYPLRCCSLLYGAIKSINIGSRLMVVTHVKACSEAAHDSERKGFHTRALWDKTHKFQKMHFGPSGNP